MVTKYFLYREIHSRWKTWQPNNTLKLQRQKKKLKNKYWKLDYLTSTFSAPVERRCPARWPHSLFSHFNIIWEISISQIIWEISIYLFKAFPAQCCQLPSYCLWHSICTSALKSAISLNTNFPVTVSMNSKDWFYLHKKVLVSKQTTDWNSNFCPRDSNFNWRINNYYLKVLLSRLEPLKPSILELCISEVLLLHCLLQHNTPKK